MKRKLFALVAAVLACTFSTAVDALQVVDLHDGATAYVNVSQADMNVIVFPKTVKVYTRGDALTIQNEDKRVFVTFKLAPKVEEVFFATDTGTYSLILVPKGIPAETVMVRMPDMRRDDTLAWERSSDYERTLKEIVRVMYSEEVPVGYDITEIKHGSPDFGGRCIPEAMYGGAMLDGWRYRCENLGAEVLHLRESEFFRDGVLAVSVEHPDVPPGGRTHVYMVRASGSESLGAGAAGGVLKPLEAR